MERQLVLILCLGCTLQAAAAIYQWKDGAGIMQFSDRRPPDQAQVIERPDLESSAAALVAAHATPAPRARRAAVAPASRKSHRVATTQPDKAREKHAQRCTSQQRRIEKIRSQLRAGYTARRGIKLNERLHAERDAFYRECR